MGMGPIPRSKIIDYAAEELGLGEDETDRFYSIIRQMDDEYMRLNSSKTDRPLNEVSVDDVDGVKSIFRGFELRGSNGGKPRMKN